MASLPNLSSLRLEGAAGPNVRRSPPPLTGAGVDDIFKSYQELQDAKAGMLTATRDGNVFRRLRGVKDKTNLELMRKEEVDDAYLRALKFAAQIYNLRAVPAGDYQNAVDNALRQALNVSSQKAESLAKAILPFIDQRSDDYINNAIGLPGFYETAQVVQMKHLLAHYFADKFVRLRTGKDRPIYKFIAETYVNLLQEIKGGSEVVQATRYQNEMMAVPGEWIEEHMPDMETETERANRMEFEEYLAYEMARGADKSTPNPILEGVKKRNREQQKQAAEPYFSDDDSDEEIDNPYGSLAKEAENQKRRRPYESLLDKQRRQERKGGGILYRSGGGRS